MSRGGVRAVRPSASKPRSLSSGYLCLLGRNSLGVFCALSLLGLLGQIVCFVYSGDVASDAFIVILGVLFLGFIR
ncbi:MAG: OpgC domain-containing protein [Methylocella sp.]